jgi:hypothetical protein
MPSGYTRVRGLHPLLATISTPIAAPVIAAMRLRRGSAGSAKGAAGFVAEAITTARQAGATGVLLARMDSAFDSHAVVSTCVRAGVRFSITTKQTRPVQAAIEVIDPGAWVPIAYPHAIYDEATQQWISDAEIAETTYTAYQSRRKSEQITVRMIVRRVKDKNVVASQGELFTAWRYHAFITDSALELVAAEKQTPRTCDHRAGQRRPEGWATAASANHAALAANDNLTRAAGCLASLFHARARTGTLRRHLITVPARIARRSRRITLRLPLNWPHRDALGRLVHRDPHPTTNSLTSSNIRLIRPDRSNHRGKAGQASGIHTPTANTTLDAIRKRSLQSRPVDPGLITRERDCEVISGQYPHRRCHATPLLGSRVAASLHGPLQCSPDSPKPPTGDKRS